VSGTTRLAKFKVSSSTLASFALLLAGPSRGKGTDEKNERSTEGWGSGNRGERAFRRFCERVSVAGLPRWGGVDSVRRAKNDALFVCRDALRRRCVPKVRKANLQARWQTQFHTDKP